MEKIDDLERKLTNRIQESQQLEQKIHILMQNEQSQKNELNFWNGKVTTLRRDAEYQQIFAENMQNENRKMQLDIDSLKRELDLKEKALALAKKELGGMVEDNERLNRMYQIVQKEAFHGIEKLKKGQNESNISQPASAGEHKKGYQPLRNDGKDPVAALPGNKTKNMWQVVDDGFGSSRDLSNITAGPGGMSEISGQVTMKRG